MDNVSREMENLRKNQKKWQKSKTPQRSFAFDGLITRHSPPPPKKNSVNLKKCQQNNLKLKCKQKKNKEDRISKNYRESTTDVIYINKCNKCTFAM